MAVDTMLFFTRELSEPREYFVKKTLFFVLMGSIFFTVSCPQKIVPEPHHFYYINYDANDPDPSTAPIDTSLMQQQTLPVDILTPLYRNEFKKPGYVFTGWYEQKHDTKLGKGMGNSYKNSAHVTNITEPGNTTTLYANWVKISALTQDELNELDGFQFETTGEPITIAPVGDWTPVNEGGTPLNTLVDAMAASEDEFILDLSEVNVTDINELFRDDEKGAFEDKIEDLGKGIEGRSIKLVTVILPKTLKHFHWNHFGACGAVKKFIVPEENPYLTTENGTGRDNGGYTVYSYRQQDNGEFMLLNGEKWKYNICAVAASATGDYEVIDSVRNISNNAFYGCKITSVNLNQVENISNYAFLKCTELKSITFPKSVKSIGGYSFSNCESLSAITFEQDSSCYRIGSRAFQGCYSAKREKEDTAYTGGLKGKQITIPKSVKQFHYQVFNTVYQTVRIVFETDEENDWYYYASKLAGKDSGYLENLTSNLPLAGEVKVEGTMGGDITDKIERENNFFYAHYNNRPIKCTISSTENGQHTVKNESGATIVLNEDEVYQATNGNYYYDYYYYWRKVPKTTP